MLVCEQLKLYNMKQQAAVLCHTDEESGKRTWGEEKKVWAQGLPQYRPIQTPGSILPLGLHNILLSSQQKAELLLAWTTFPSYSLLRVLTNTTLSNWWFWSCHILRYEADSLNSELCEGSQKGCCSLPLSGRVETCSFTEGQVPFNTLILTVSARNDG